jgi:hypothetical protein
VRASRGAQRVGLRAEVQRRGIRVGTRRGGEFGGCQRSALVDRSIATGAVGSGIARTIRAATWIAATTSVAPWTELAHDHVRRSFDQESDPAAMAVLVPDPVRGSAVYEDGQAAGRGSPRVGTAARGVDARIIDAQRGSTVDEDIRRALDRRADPRMRAGRATMRVQRNVRLVA